MFLVSLLELWARLLKPSLLSIHLIILVTILFQPVACANFLTKAYLISQRFL